MLMHGKACLIPILTASEFKLKIISDLTIVLNFTFSTLKSMSFIVAKFCFHKTSIT